MPPCRPTSGALRPRTAGLRPHALQLDCRGAPLLTVWGGEPAAFRWLAEDAADALVGLLDPRGGTPRAAWTRHASLPGGDLSYWLDEATLEQPREPQDDLAQALAALRRRHPWIELPLARRWLAAYGDRVRRLLDGVRGPADLGPQVAPGLHDLELHYLKRVEWAASADDVLWRRTRLGLAYTSAERRQVADWFAAQAARPGVAAVHTSWHSRLGRP
ncbi:MAG: hypothetical protein HZB72_03790 [Burkholderiales bacterium]|nr:hypothetical protein [Burkholderiales bacterium]